MLNTNDTKIPRKQESFKAKLNDILAFIGMFFQKMLMHVLHKILELYTQLYKSNTFKLLVIWTDKQYVATAK